MGLIEPIQKALTLEWYTTPTPIQAKAIPLILERKDIIGIAQTGTGKTAAFAIPTLQILDWIKKSAHPDPQAIKSLILTPTRELAIQIQESFSAYWKYLHLKHAVIFWWVSQFNQVNQLKRWVDILVATPGRLLDLINQGFIDLKHVEIFILDEADRMLNMGFINDVKKIITKIPKKRQSLFFSATMPKEISSLADSILTNPVKVEVTPVSSTTEKVAQSIYFVSKNDKKHLLAHLLQDAKEIQSALVFTRTKHGADRVVKELAGKWIIAEAIHGNKSQNARQRALENFKSRKTRVLIATDIAARWIDVDNLSHVFNYDLPNESETYVHRIGRTGRAGANGKAFSFCDEDEKPYLKDIQKLIGKSVPIIDEHPYPLASGNSMIINIPRAKSQPQGQGRSFQKKSGQGPKARFWRNNNKGGK